MKLKDRKKSNRSFYEKILPSSYFPEFFSKEVRLGTKSEFPIVSLIDKTFELRSADKLFSNFSSKILENIGIDVRGLQSLEISGLYLFLQSKKALKKENVPVSDVEELLDILDIQAKVLSNFFASEISLKPQRLQLILGDRNGPKNVFRIFFKKSSAATQIKKFKGLVKILYPNLTFVFVKEGQDVSL